MRIMAIISSQANAAPAQGPTPGIRGNYGTQKIRLYLSWCATRRKRDNQRAP
jgi:hypothetical protein